MLFQGAPALPSFAILCTRSDAYSLSIIDIVVIIFILCIKETRSGSAVRQHCRGKVEQSQAKPGPCRRSKISGMAAGWLADCIVDRTDPSSVNAGICQEPQSMHTVLMRGSTCIRQSCTDHRRYLCYPGSSIQIGIVLLRVYRKCLLRRGFAVNVLSQHPNVACGKVPQRVRYHSTLKTARVMFLT